DLAALRVEPRVGLPEADPGMVDRTEPAPFEELAQLVDLCDGVECRRITAFGDDTGILVLDLGAALGELAQHPPDRLQYVERLEPRDDPLLPVMAGATPVGAAPPI